MGSGDTEEGPPYYQSYQSDYNVVDPDACTDTDTAASSDSGNEDVGETAL
jgi:hypothetical protein